MSLLDSIINGKTPLPPKVMIYGYEGVGKSTFAAAAPKPIFIQTENGLNMISTNKFPQAKTWDEVVEQINAVATEEHDFQTLVIDSLSGLERLIFAEVCKRFGVKNIEKADGGYARGYKHALDWWESLLQGLEMVNTKRNMMIILIAHVGVQEVKDPEQQTYHRTAPRMHHLAEGMVSQWCDAVLQAKQNFRIQKTTEGFGSERAIATALGADGGERVIRTIGTAAVIAKNRYGLPEYMPLDFNTFYEAVTKSIGAK
ncbi:MAG: ATP-binding protein [Lentisphaeria bacterium]|nr:ATP-binding protein [Lentisphaeria bacterium]